jgi:hypothetical protein
MENIHSEKRDTVFVWSAGAIKAQPGKSHSNHSGMRRKRSLVACPVDIRRYPRLDLKLPILYRVVGDDIIDAPPSLRPFLLAKSQDVSPIGLCLSLEEPLAVGTLMSLTIYASDPQDKFEALARVVWVRPADDGVRSLIGLQFVVLDGAEVREERHALVESMVRRLSRE